MLWSNQIKPAGLVLSIILLVVDTGSNAAFARDSDSVDSATNPAQFVIVGAGQLPEYEGADEMMTVPFVVSRFSLFGREFEIDGLQFRYDLVEDSVWRAGPALSLTIPRGDDADSAAVARLPEVDLAVELGAYAGFRTPFTAAKEGTLSGYVFARRDVTGAHDAWLVTADLEYFFAAARALRFGFAVNATFVSSEYAETYYSISDADSLVSGLPVFQAGSGLKDVGAEAYSVLSFNERSGIFLRATYNRLLNDFADSPVVALEGDENQWFYGVGYFRRF